MKARDKMDDLCERGHESERSNWYNDSMMEQSGAKLDTASISSNHGTSARG